MPRFTASDHAVDQHRPAPDPQHPISTFDFLLCTSPTFPSTTFPACDTTSSSRPGGRRDPATSSARGHHSLHIPDIDSSSFHTIISRPTIHHRPPSSATWTDITLSGRGHCLSTGDMPSICGVPLPSCLTDDLRASSVLFDPLLGDAFVLADGSAATTLLLRGGDSAAPLRQRGARRCTSQRCSCSRRRWVRVWATGPAALSAGHIFLLVDAAQTGLIRLSGTVLLLTFFAETLYPAGSGAVSAPGMHAVPQVL